MNVDNSRPERGSGSDDELRHLLNDAVSDVEPRDALDSIRSRTSVTPLRSRRPWILGAGAAALATAATIAAVAAMGSNPGTTTSPQPPVAGGGPTAAAPSQESGPTEAARPDPSTEPSAEPSSSVEPSPQKTPSKATQTVTSPPLLATQTVPVYYVGETSRGPRLYREFHVVEAGTSSKATLALTEAVQGSPMDADYRSDWPARTSASGFVDDEGLLAIEIANSEAGLRSRPAGMTVEEATIAVEQLIYTAQAASQTRAAVQFFIDREPADTVLGVSTSGPARRGQEIEVLAMVWINDPTEGAAVSDGFTVSGLANAFEANVQWELMQGDKVVQSGFTTAEECCTMAPYSFKVTAPPGDYTIAVHDSDPSEGEGLGPTYDTKAITVG